MRKRLLEVINGLGDGETISTVEAAVKIGVSHAAVMQCIGWATTNVTDEELNTMFEDSFYVDPMNRKFKKLIINKSAKCLFDKSRKDLICGVGVNDYDFSVKLNRKHIKSYECWMSMMKRCYSQKINEKYPTYVPCYVCDEWLSFSIFKEWYDENFIDGYCIDKDILVKGNHVYSPETCCFVPNEINTLFTKSNATRGILPVGVTKTSHSNSYTARITIGNVRQNIGTSKTPEGAFMLYKEKKEENIKRMAMEYFEKGLISEKVKDAMMRYQVEITD